MDKRNERRLSMERPPELGQVHNIPAKTRQERKGEVHKEDLEKMRLRQRRECYYHHEEVSLVQPPDSLGYIPESDRFITDAAAVEKTERDRQIARKEQIFHNKRLGRAATEEQRWKSMEAEYEEDAALQLQIRQEGAFCRSSKTSMPYDPVTLKYGEGRDGDCLRYSDEALKYRSALRADNLQRRTNSGFNPITGEETARVPIPEKPSPPSFLQLHAGM